MHCKWCANPESQLAKIQILWDKKKCLHCHHCLEICLQKAISLKNDNIFIDTNKCTLCKQCINTCPQKALTSEGEIKTVQQVLDIVLQDEVFYGLQNKIIESAHTMEKKYGVTFHVQFKNGYPPVMNDPT